MVGFAIFGQHTALARRKLRDEKSSIGYLNYLLITYKGRLASRMGAEDGFDRKRDEMKSEGTDLGWPKIRG